MGYLEQAVRSRWAVPMTAFLIQLSQYWNTLVTVTWWSKRATVSVVWFCVLWLATILLLEIFLNRRFPFPVRCLLGTLVIAGVILTAMLVISLQSEKPWLTLGYDEVGYLIITYTICLLIGSIVLMINKERRHEKEIEMLRIENLSSQYNAIANQVSPHFFFNALSNLSSLVRGDKKQESLEYIGNLSGIFRYIIRFKESSLTTLGEELNFINSYKQLMDVRFAESYTCEVDIPAAGAEHAHAQPFAAAAVRKYRQTQRHRQRAPHADHDLVQRQQRIGDRQPGLPEAHRPPESTASG